MFTHLVMLKKEPWFIYCEDEAGALAISSKFQGEVSGIVVGESLIVKQPRYVHTLSQEEILQITHEVEEKDEPEPAELPIDVELDIEQSLKEMTDELSKELES